jgi:hypothetical protein
MPKTLVLFDTTNADSAALASIVAEGARSVRFAEVDLRSAADAVDLSVYDGIALDASSTSVRDLLERTGPLRSKVAALFGAADDSLLPLLELLGRAGMIVLPPGTGASALSAADAESARVLGKRLCDVVAWITHARSHHHH